MYPDSGDTLIYTSCPFWSALAYLLIIHIYNGLQQVLDYHPAITIIIRFFSDILWKKKAYLFLFMVYD